MAKRRTSVERSSRQKGKSSLSSFMPFVAGGVILAAIATYVVIQPPPTDPSTFCPRDSKDLGVTAFVIDVSDKLTNSQAARLKNELRNISIASIERPSAFLKKGEKLVIYFVEPEGKDPNMVFSMCHPGDVANRTWEEELSEGAVFARKKWQKFTDDTMLRIDAKIEGSIEADTSPIVETIHYVRNNNFPPPGLMGETRNYRIVLWSDMLQNSSEGNHFKTLDDFKDILKRKPLELNGIQFFVFQLISEKYSEHQTDEHVFWWRKVFATANADLNSWDKF